MSDIVGTTLYQSLRDTYRRYLFTAHRIADSEPDLREAFWEALGREDFISREPILTAIPTYETSLSPRELAQRSAPPHLHEALLRLGEEDRPLYEHQVNAIRAIQEGRSVVIATGTGSGKTESFLLPILDDLLRDLRPGVRAIIVYPLNALANDQLRRLRQLLVSVPVVTFGRYTGESPHVRGDLTDAELAEVLDPNERVSRDELRASPPHILLTNFAMLEYLLLRPQDSPLFGSDTLKFVVLDEAHAYQGAQGIDVGLLMRRLARRVSKPLQFILTSATLGGDASSIRKFAHNLTGADIGVEDIIPGTFASGFDPHRVADAALETYAQRVPTSAALHEWAKALANNSELESVLGKFGIHGVSPTSGGLYEWLSRDNRLARLHDLLSQRPQSLVEASKALWGEDSDLARRATEWLCLLGSRAARDAASSPLLHARYHFLFRGLRGATVCLAPGCSAQAVRGRRPWSHLMLESRATCERCESHVLPMATCFTCGLPVLRICENADGTSWQQLPPSGVPNTVVHLLTWKNVVDEEEDEHALVTEQLAVLCLSCKGLSLDGALGMCCSAPQHITLQRLNTDKDGNLKRCPNCGSEARRFPSALREFVTGEDAAGTVLVEELIRSLPEEDATKPVGGRRVLAFSDSRQRAAFFAPYLARTAAETQVMAPLLQAVDTVVRRDSRGATIDEIALAFAKHVERQSYVVLRRPLDDAADEFRSEVKRARSIAADDRSALRRDAKVALLRHFVAAPRRRDTLQGLALATIEYDLSAEQHEVLTSLLSNIGLGTADASPENVVQALIRIIVRRQAIEWPEDVQARMLGPYPNQVTLHRTEAGSAGGRSRVRWNPYMAQIGVTNVVRRSPQATLLASCLGIEDPSQGRDQIEGLLDTLWEALRDAEVLRLVAPNEYVVPYDRLIVIREVRWAQCGRCSAVIPNPLGGRCPMPGCGATLVEAGPDAARWERDHQRRRFTDSSVLPLNVKEHTAQLTQGTGREYQRQFTEGLINVLSCSTTFEMGVDVGQLLAVYLRNMPPSAANYVQRAGRAGRRREGAAIALTFARNLPHDQATFYEPESLLSGMVGVPRVSMDNPKLAQRHANAWILAAYMTDAGTVQDNATVAEFFFLPTAAEAPQSRYGTWVQARRDQLRNELTEVLRDSRLDPVSAIDDSVQGLLAVAQSITDELAGLDQQIEAIENELKLVPEDSVSLAHAVKRARKLRDELLNEDRLIDRLSSEHWLPSYAFPQDVLRLRVLDAQQAARFKLERDAEYGISEYAPGAEVVADGRLIKSGAIDLRGRAAHLRRYRICRKCHNVEVTSTADAMQGRCSTCAAQWTGPTGMGRPFVVPKGFSTVYEERAQEVRLSRVLPPRNTEVFLVRGAPADAFQQHRNLKGLRYGLQSDGQLFLANEGPRGRSFSLCLTCGRHAPRGGAHRSPWGARCAGTFSKVDLAYEFETDTVQIRFDDVTPRVPPISNDVFWSSFEMAVVAAASEYLDIAARDLNATHRAQKTGGLAGELVLYDRVPGGAGYVGRIVENLPDIFGAALARVQDCRNPMCDIHASCDACLRTYYNQLEWDRLQRQAVVDWLEPALAAMRTR